MNNQTTMRFRIVTGDFDTLSPNANMEADMCLELVDNEGDIQTFDLKTLLQVMFNLGYDLNNRVSVLEDAELP
jgi:hypothetical protein